MEIQTLKECLGDEKAPIAKRTRCIFKLRQIGGKDAIDALAVGFESSSVLLSHEVAYCLGQMQDVDAVPLLISVLQNDKYHVIVRHEAAEALGAIGQKDSLKILESFVSDKNPEISDTCQLAIARIKWLQENKGQSQTDSKKLEKEGEKSSEEGKEKKDEESPYNSVDPAPALPSKTSIDDLKKILLDSSLPLFQRYRAMFALRNKNDDDAANALAAGFHEKETNAIFKHEIAYVLGQMQSKNPAAVAALKKVLEDSKEHEMVRHEAAEALGSIADDKITPVLKKFQTDSQRIVKYWPAKSSTNLWKIFRYCSVADPIQLHKPEQVYDAAVQGKL